MDKKDLELTCPCCDSRLTVDLRTEKVVRARRPEEVDEAGKPKLTADDWDDMSSRVQGRLDSARSKFDEGLARERSKPKDLDALFDQAQRKLDDGEDPEAETGSESGAEEA